MDFSDTDSPAYWDIADISAIYGGISKILKILVNSHVLAEPTEFYKDRSMYGEMASKIRGRGSLFFAAASLTTTLDLWTDMQRRSALEESTAAVSPNVRE